MKNVLYTCLAIFLLTLTACQDKMMESFKANAPVYMSYEALRSGVKQTSPTELKNPGKIYFKDNYIYIVEDLKGVHIMDISNATSPKNINFIEVLGCMDIAISGNTLFADSYVDVVALDVSNVNNVKEVSRLKDALPYVVPPLADDKARMANVDKEKGVVIDWEVKQVKEEIEIHRYPVYPETWFSSDRADFLNSSQGYSSSASSSSGFGIGGSMARFGLYDKYLYAVDKSSLNVINVSDTKNMKKESTTPVGWNVETLFIYNKHLFIGSQTGMYVMSVASPTAPAYVSQYNHWQACDPVYVSNGFAYVTLRGGSACRNTAINRLDILKMSEDYKQLSLQKSYDMTNPHGLSIEGKTLFLCDGSAGLKVFDLTNQLTTLTNIATFPDIHAKDVIALENYLFMIGDDGFYLYNKSNLKDIKLLGKIAVNK